MIGSIDGIKKAKGFKDTKERRIIKKDENGLIY